MKKITLTFTILLCYMNGFGQNYSFTNFTETYNDLTGTISLNNGEIWDDPAYALTLPFPFIINGVTLTSVNVSDGFIIQNNTTNNIAQGLAAFSIDLIDRGNNGTTSLSPISYKTDGTIGNRILKIQYKNCGSFYDSNLSMFINLQIWLYESNNSIEYRYGASSITSPSIFYDGDTGALIGFGGEDLNGNISNAHFLTGSASNPTLSTSTNLSPITGTPSANTVYRFTPTTLSNTKNQKSSISVYPNPFNDKILIEGLESNFGYSIYNIQGKEIQSETIKSKNGYINTNDIASGIYLLKIVTENEVKIQKIIKN